MLDSRGTPTVESMVELACGISACASAPSGASTGKNEAHELRDGGDAFGGKSVYEAVSHVNHEIDSALIGFMADDQGLIDSVMTELDGTPNLRRFGANAILSVSLACAKAAAMYHELDLFEYLGGKNAVTLPVPMMNVLNGGAHADNNLDIQEFMLMPSGADSFDTAVRMVCETYAALKKLLQSKGLSTAVGDEGGFAPNLASDEDALALLSQATEAAGYHPGVDMFFALDCAASEWEDGGGYRMPKRNQQLDSGALMEYYAGLARRWPLISIEDPFGQEDFDSFCALTAALGKKTQVVGDDLFTTNPERLARGIKLSAGSAILIKPNQIGTLSQTMKCVRMAQQAGFGTIVSHRSGETSDTSIADIAVALNCGQIKTGAPARGERVAKYNRLLYIERKLSSCAVYGVNP